MPLGILLRAEWKSPNKCHKRQQCRDQRHDSSCFQLGTHLLCYLLDTDVLGLLIKVSVHIKQRLFADSRTVIVPLDIHKLVETVFENEFPDVFSIILQCFFFVAVLVNDLVVALSETIIAGFALFGCHENDISGSQPVDPVVDVLVAQHGESTHILPGLLIGNGRLPVGKSDWIAWTKL